MAARVSPFVTEPCPYWENILHMGTVRVYPAGSVIYQQGQPSSHLYYLLQGRVKVSTLRPDGSELTVGIFECQTTFGESAALDGLPYYATARTLVESRICAFHRDVVIAAAMRDRSLLEELLRAVVRKQRMLALIAESLNFLRATSRVALILARLASEYGIPSPDGRGKRLGMHFTQEQLATLVGTSRVTVARVIADLIRQGILARRKWELVVLDEEGLWRLATEGNGARPSR